VIVALYNAAPYLEECLDSVLAQDYAGPLEVSVHDDASTDESRATLEVRAKHQST
jgi:glycosyltransferase involved in cell wall biosynthesis